MNEIIKVNCESADHPTVMGRELHEALEVKTRYDKWFSRMCEYGFNENTDFVAIGQKRPTAQGNETTYTDHQLTIDMAKEICMLQRTEKGKYFRQYFIEVEKAWNTPEMIMGRALQIAQRQLDSIKAENKQLAEKIEQDKPKVIFADAVSVANTSILVGELAKIINFKELNL